MKIVHISTKDNSGGASRAAYRLHCGLHRLGNNSSMFVAEKTIDDSKVIAFKQPKDKLSRITKILYREYLALSLKRYQKSRPLRFFCFSELISSFSFIIYRFP